MSFLLALIVLPLYFVGVALVICGALVAWWLVVFAGGLLCAGIRAAAAALAGPLLASRGAR